MTMERKEENVKITDNKGFVYQVLLKHSPHFGFSTAYYGGDIIGQVELGKIHEPLGDDDREWEMYEERFAEWTDEIKYNIEFICKDYFNNKTTSLRTKLNINAKIPDPLAPPTCKNCNSGLGDCDCGQWEPEYPSDKSGYAAAPQKGMKESIITDEQIEQAWGYANFGSTPKRKVISESLKKVAQGYHNGSTATAITKELGLIEGREKNRYYVLTDLGLKYLLADESPSPSEARDAAPQKGMKELREYADTVSMMEFMDDPGAVVSKLLTLIYNLNQASESPSPSVAVDHEAEKEVIMEAFDKVYKMFQSRSWIMEGRGSYRYDDDRYKEEVRYLFDEFDALHNETWKNIKSKSADFRRKVIEQYKKDLQNPYIRLSETGTIDESPSPSEAGDAVEFAEWINSDDCYFSFSKHDGIWYHYADAFPMTTADLYQLFHQFKNSKIV